MKKCLFNIGLAMKKCLFNIGLAMKNVCLISDWL
jgi:hypothetical protein